MAFRGFRNRYNNYREKWKSGGGWGGYAKRKAKDPRIYVAVGGAAAAYFADQIPDVAGLPPGAAVLIIGYIMGGQKNETIKAIGLGLEAAGAASVGAYLKAKSAGMINESAEETNE